MLLSDADIRALQESDVIIEPFDLRQLQPASYELHWDGTLRYMRHSTDGMMSWERSERHFGPVQSPEFAQITPVDFALVSTVETVRIPSGYAARVEGKSSLARIGLSIHTTSGFIDPGFHGTITLELSNNSGNKIWLRRGQKIGQLCLFRLTSAANKPYGHPDLGSAYQGQQGVTVGEGTRG